MLCRIAHNPGELAKAEKGPSERPSITSAETDLFRSAIVSDMSDDVGRDEHFFSLFQVF